MEDASTSETTKLIPKPEKSDAPKKTEFIPKQEKTSTDKLCQSTIVEMKADPEKDEGNTPFLLRNCKIKDASQFKQLELLKLLHIKYEKELQWWLRKAKLFKALNLGLTILILLINFAQVFLFQIPSIPQDLKHSLATIIPVVGSLFITIQQKLAWQAKSSKAKKSTAVYSKLVKHIEHRIEIIEHGVVIDDVIELWNLSLLKEVEEVPAILVPY